MSNVKQSLTDAVDELYYALSTGNDKVRVSRIEKAIRLIEKAEKALERVSDG